MLTGHDGLHLINSRLSAALPHEAVTLRKVVQQALNSDGVRRAGAMSCQRISGKQSYLLHVVPLEPSAADCGRGPLAAVLIFDPAREPMLPEQVVRELYGLTRAEAAVAGLVLRGEGIQSICDRLSLSTSTVRTHLQAIFVKTGTHRQAELVKLLSMLSP